jgi:Bax protein
MNNLSQPRLLSLSFVLLILTIFSQVCFSENDENVILPPLEGSITNPITSLPDFSAIQDVKQKKQTFFALLYPIVQQENAHILTLRESIEKLYEKAPAELSTNETNWLLEVGEYYQLPVKEVDADLFDYLMRRVDFIPPSLALSQAAIESGWGTSRFSTSANNLFGAWCFEPGCGIVPSSREAGLDHEVATFETVNESVRSYLHSLNTRQPYTELRQVREEKRQNGEPIKGIELAAGLAEYSAEGEQYVTKLSRFIQQNKLQRFTQPQP